MKNSACLNTFINPYLNCILNVEIKMGLENHIIRESYITRPTNFKAPHLCVLGPGNKSIVIRRAEESPLMNPSETISYSNEIYSRLSSLFYKTVSYVSSNPNDPFEMLQQSTKE